jgi:hypothetical protein
MKNKDIKFKFIPAKTCISVGDAVMLLLLEGVRWPNEVVAETGVSQELAAKILEYRDSVSEKVRLGANQPNIAMHQAFSSVTSIDVTMAMNMAGDYPLLLNEGTI